ncbi:nucleotide-diphospho-sugar transferase [Hyaloraphidium curvatum]|nr:nucleotide-diphospho-sugar transferase [Hyaloraphidium curvatum]
MRLPKGPAPLGVTLAACTLLLLLSVPNRGPPPPQAGKLAIVALLRPALEPRDNLTAFFRGLEEHVLPRNPGDILLFHTGEYAARHAQDVVRRHTRLPVRFERVPEAEWAVPAHLEDRAAWKTPFGDGYRLMCRWNLLLPRLLGRRGYAWMLRLDTDSAVLSPVGDLVRRMERDGKQHAFRLCAGEATSTTEMLPELVRLWASLRGLSPAFFCSLFEPPCRGKWRPAMFYNNFYLGATSFWLRPDVAAFVDFVGASGGVVSHRWGDAPVATFALALYAARDEILELEFGYRHGETFAEGRTTCREHGLL